MVVFYRANDERYLNEYKGALNDFTVSLSLDSEYFYAYKNCGVTYLNMVQLEPAMKGFRKSVELDPRNEEASKLPDVAMVTRVEAFKENSLNSLSTS